MKFNWRGEPLLNPNLGELIKFAKDEGILETIINTNATNLTEKKGNELINPFDLIVEHLPLDINLLEVYADCQFNANIDDSGNPLYTEWESSAYVVSEEGRNWFDNLENARNQEKKANHHDVILS